MIDWLGRVRSTLHIEIARRSILVVVLLVAVLTTVQPAVAFDSPPTEDALTTRGDNLLLGNRTGGSVLIVDDDGNTAYTSIQAAVRDADDGDTVRVRPGTYREEVTVDSNITLVALDGATLNGSTINANTPNIDRAITIGETAKPIIEGFTITGYAVGIQAISTTADWQLRNTTIHAGFIAVRAGSSDTSSDWLVEGVTIHFTGEPERGIDARSSTGNWTVRNTTIRNAQDAVDASETHGNWHLERVTIHGGLIGVNAKRTAGAWRIEETSIRNVVYGVNSYRATGPWLISNSSIVNTSPGPVYRMYTPMPEGVGVYAGETTAEWTIRGTRFYENEAGGIVAPNATPRGRAVGNHWGNRTEPAEGDCLGNVTCTVKSQISTATPTAQRTRTTSRTTTLPTTERTAESTHDMGTSVTASDTPTEVALPLSPVLALLASLVGGLLVAHNRVG